MFHFPCKTRVLGVCGVSFVTDLTEILWYKSQQSPKKLSSSFSLSKFLASMLLPSSCWLKHSCSCSGNHIRELTFSPLSLWATEVKKIKGYLLQTWDSGAHMLLKILVDICLHLLATNSFLIWPKVTWPELCRKH